MTFRLTFNKPAMSRYFPRGENGAVQVRIKDGLVYFRPIEDNSAQDAIMVVPRERGGGEAAIEGLRADELHLALTNPQSPFFTLIADKNGWWAAVPWNKTDKNPPRTEPHVRIWEPRDDSAARSLSINENKLIDFLNEVRSCRAIVQAHESEKRPGRPTKEVTTAKATLAMFEHLAKADRKDCDTRRFRQPVMEQPFFSSATPRFRERLVH